MPRAVNTFDQRMLEKADSYSSMTSNHFAPNLGLNNFIPSGTTFATQPNNIVSNGLVLCIDSSIENSYPQSGTTWNDLSGNNYNFVLVNNPIYKQNAVNLNGTNNYIYLPSHNSNLAFPNGSMTLIAWDRTNSYGAYGGIISTDTAGDEYWKIIRDNLDNFYMFRWRYDSFAFPAFTTGKWNMYCAVRDSSNNLYLYFNGVLVTTTTVSSITIPSQNNPITLGSYRYNNAVAGQYLSNQDVGQILIYNRPLSSSEVAQNYNAAKSRFL